jgi:hypothetical protein
VKGCGTVLSWDKASRVVQKYQDPWLIHPSGQRGHYALIKSTNEPDEYAAHHPPDPRGCTFAAVISRTVTFNPELLAGRAGVL